MSSPYLSFRIAAVGVLTLLGACTVGPDYQRPPAVTPASFKEQDGWKPSQPRDALDRGAWWSIYQDPVLDGLVRQIDISNQTLKQSEAAFRNAQAVVQQARASFSPTLSLSGSDTRSYSGGSSSSRSTSSSSSSTSTSSTTSTAISSGGRYSSSYSVSTGASWEPDLWGRISRTVEGDVASAQASAADLASARLSAQATLATDYFELRAEDELKRLLDSTIEGYTRSRDIARNQYNAGTAAQADVVTAQTQLDSTRAQAVNVGVLRAQLEHAIAVLVGKAPSEFAIIPAPLTGSVPVVPTDLPSALLERRPDIAAAERRAASANAQIGVAIAAFYPTITLSASYGYASSAIDTLLHASNSLWSLGPSLSATLYDGGARSAQVAGARALYDQDVASYRQIVLTSFQQVEDELSTLRVLEQQAGIENSVVQSAQEAERLTLNQYRAGTVPYSSVITAQATTLSNRQTALTVRQNRLVASVALVQALGGGWDASQLPPADRMDIVDTPVAADTVQPVRSTP
ncbi:MAG TPA: efflux transporter outer membrane subunit [Stellaceae bacterium]|nr:efflux transporter outer membrane subunit [Stellaceae bacterium]